MSYVYSSSHHMTLIQKGHHRSLFPRGHNGPGVMKDAERFSFTLRSGNIAAISAHLRDLVKNKYGVNFILFRDIVSVAYMIQHSDRRPSDEVLNFLNYWLGGLEEGCILGKSELS